MDNAHNISRGFNSKERQDVQKFPHLKNWIEKLSGHPGIVKSPTRRVQHALLDIAKRNGEYAVENMRVLEWVCTKVLEILITANISSKSGKKVVVHQTSINDDVWHHLDAHIVERNRSESTLQYGVDFTFDKSLISVKKSQLEQRSSGITRHGAYIPLPAMVVYFPQGEIKKIVKGLEGLLAGGEILSADSLKLIVRAFIFAHIDQFRSHIDIAVPDKYTPLESLRFLSQGITTGPSPR